MAIDNFIPEIWSARIFQALENKHVFASLANREYEGDITASGDTVRINSVGAITINSYTKNSTSITPETLSDSQLTLSIDQAKYFAFQVDDVDKAQQNPKVIEEAMRKAGVALSETVDDFFAALHADAGIVTGLGTTGTPIEINSANVVEYISLVSQKMHEANATTADRFMVVPPWFHHKMVLAGIAQETTNAAIMANGHIGHWLGLDIHISNNIVDTSSAKYKILAGVKGSSLTYAEQIVSVEAYRPEAKFADAIKGLHLYGGKVVRAADFACLTANNAAEA